MSKFIDQAQIEVRSGDGGNGAVAWRREKYEPMGGPAGGNGGKGGHVYIEASKDVNTLIDFRFKKKFLAAPGQKGGSALRSGKAAEDLIIKVPVGTLIRDSERDQLIVDLSSPGMRVLVAEGGKGGRGNATFATPTRRAPHFCEPGEPGVIRHLELELKLLADVGLVGLPNAGKSTLLAAITKAKPKIAAYPFSTLEPGLGVAKGTKGDGYVIADIPGLIEGASKGLGLGHDFLRHIERTRLILHLVDITSENLKADIATIDHELRTFNRELANREQLLVLTKVDLLGEEEAEKIRTKLSSLYPKRQIMAISAATHRGLDKLQYAIEEALSRLTKPIEAAPETIIVDANASVHQEDGFTVYRKRKKFFVEGDGILRLLAVTDSKSPESIHHFNQQLKHLGVMDELVKQDIKPGSEVVIGGLTFAYGEDLF
jgi:GTP-binding protein